MSVQPFRPHFDRVVSISGIELHVVVVQSLSRVQLVVTPWTAASQASLSFTISQSLLKLMFVEPMIPYNHLILCHPFSRIRVFSNESVLHIRWSKYWSLSFSISPSNEYSGLISFRINWFDLLAVQGTLKSILQDRFKKHHFFSTQPSLRSSLPSVRDYWKNHSFD